MGKMFIVSSYQTVQQVHLIHFIFLYPLPASQLCSQNKNLRINVHETVEKVVIEGRCKYRGTNENWRMMLVALHILLSVLLTTHSFPRRLIWQIQASWPSNTHLCFSGPTVRTSHSSLQLTVIIWRCSRQWNVGKRGRRDGIPDSAASLAWPLLSLTLFFWL